MTSTAPLLAGGVGGGRGVGTLVELVLSMHSQHSLIIARVYNNNILLIIGMQLHSYVECMKNVVTQLLPFPPFLPCVVLDIWSISHLKSVNTRPSYFSACNILGEAWGQGHIRETMIFNLSILYIQALVLPQLR